MLLSIENARKTLPSFVVLMVFLSVIATAMFIAPLFRNITIQGFFVFIGIAACAGCLLGVYWKYWYDCGTRGILLVQLYFLFTLEFMFGGGGAATAPLIAGRVELCWLAFYTNAFCMAISLLGGMYLEAKALGCLSSHTRDQWKAKLETHIDYARHQVIPAGALTVATETDAWNRYGLLIVVVGSANIPLLFESFGGGRYNAIFLFVPVLTGTLAYINLKNLGPAIFRLLLLRKLEKSTGRRFVNADLEQIQELRRGFFLSRWLMKDYVAAPPDATASAVTGRRSRRTS